MGGYFRKPFLADRCHCIVLFGAKEEGKQICEMKRGSIESLVLTRSHIYTGSASNQSFLLAAEYDHVVKHTIEVKIKHAGRLSVHVQPSTSESESQSSLPMKPKKECLFESI